MFTKKQIEFILGDNDWIEVTNNKRSKILQQLILKGLYNCSIGNGKYVSHTLNGKGRDIKSALLTLRCYRVI